MNVSVIIATYQRPEILERCLDHLARQERAPKFEVVVSIDGEEPDTRALLEARKAEWPFELTVLSAPHAGQASTINRAARAARGELLITLGDDIYAGPHLVERHVERHQELNHPQVAVIGRTEWHPRLAMDRFLRWETRQGVLFAYGRLTPYTFVPGRFLYGCNYSMPRDLMLQCKGMDENHAVWTDTILAYRAHKLGLRVFYDPDALAWHDDAWTVERVCARRYRKGRIAAVYLRDEPEFAQFVSVPRLTPWRTLRYGLSRVVRPLAERLNWSPLYGWCWIHAINWSFVQGYRDGLRDGGSAP